MMGARALEDWLLAAPFLAIGGMASLLNWMIVIGRRLTGRYSSLLPFVGGLLGSAGLWIAPRGPWTLFWWLPLILDPGSAPALFRLLVWNLQARRPPSTERGRRSTGVAAEAPTQFRLSICGDRTAVVSIGTEKAILVLEPGQVMEIRGTDAHEHYSLELHTDQAPLRIELRAEGRGDFSVWQNGHLVRGPRDGSR